MKKLIDLYKNLADWPKKVFHNMNWLFLDVAFRMWVSFFFWTWIARYFWPNDFWVYNYALAFVWMFSFIANLWLDWITIKELIDHPDKKNEILGTSFALKLAWWIISVLLIILIYKTLIYKDNLEFIIILIISASYIFQSFNVVNFYFQSKVEGRTNVISTSIWFIASNLFKIYIILSWKEIIWLAIAYVSDFIISAITYIYFYKKNGHSINKWWCSINYTKEILRKSLPLAFSWVFLFIFYKIDQIIIWTILWNKEVWLYSVSVIISDSTQNIFNIIWPSLFPAIIYSKKISNNIYFNRMKLYYSMFSIVALLVIFPISYFSKEIILLLFWVNYSQSADVLKIYIWSMMPTALMVPLWQHFINEWKIKYALYSTAIWATTSIIMNYLLIPIYWLIWAAYSTTIPSIISVLIYLLFKETRWITIFWIKYFNPYYLINAALKNEIWR